MTLIIMIAILLILGFYLLLRLVLKSSDDVDFNVNFKKGEMSVKKKKSQR
jgi:hypothetical protein